MTRTEILEKLLQHGALPWAELIAITGWSRQRLARGLEVAMGPLGPVRRSEFDGRWIYRLARDDERQRKRGGGPKRGSEWNEARRVAFRRRLQEIRGTNAVRGLPAGERAPAGRLEALQPGMPGLWLPLSVVRAAPATAAGPEAGPAAPRAGDLDGVWARGAGAAGRREARSQGVEGMGS